MVCPDSSWAVKLSHAHTVVKRTVMRYFLHSPRSTRLRGPYAARHTCGDWPHHAVSCVSRRTSTARDHVYSPFGAVYTASRLAVRQVKQVGRLLELLVELRSVPVRAV